MQAAKTNRLKLDANLQLVAAPLYLDVRRILKDLLEADTGLRDGQVLVCSGSAHRSINDILLPNHKVCHLHDAVMMQLGCMGKERMRKELADLATRTCAESDDDILQAVREGAHDELPALATKLIRTGELRTSPWRQLIVLDGHDLSSAAMNWLLELSQLEIDVWVIFDPVLRAISNGQDQSIWAELQDRCPVSAFMHAESLSRKVATAIDGIARMYGCAYRPQAGFSVKGSHEVRTFADIEAECDAIADFIDDCNSLSGGQHHARVFGLYHNIRNGLESQLISRVGPISLHGRSLFFERTGRLLIALARTVTSRELDALNEAVQLVGFDANVVAHLRKIGASTDPTCLTSEIVESLPDNRARRVCTDVLTLLSGVGTLLESPNVETAVSWLGNSGLSTASAARIHGLMPLVGPGRNLDWLVSLYEECIRKTDLEPPLISFYPARPPESKYTWVTLQGLPASNQEELARQVYAALTGVKGSVVVAGQWSKNHTLYRLLETSGFIAS